MWRCIRPVIAGKRTARPVPSADIDAMNRYFASVGTQTARKVDQSGPDLPVRLPRVSTGGFRVQPVTPERIFSTVAQMSNSSASGADGLCLRFIKLCLPALLKKFSTSGSRWSLGKSHCILSVLIDALSCLTAA